MTRCRLGGAAILALALTAPLAAAEQPGLEELQKTVSALQEEVARLRSAAAGDERIRELERRIDLLAAELEKLRTAGATEVEAPTGTKGLAPAASKVYGISRGVSIGGYGEVVYNDFAKKREDGGPSLRGDRLDYLRQVLYVGYKFSDKILFNSELEFEHASSGEGAEEKGEISVEFGYLELQAGRHLGLRAGLLLLPLGFVNELHEPPIFHGTRRPEVETAIIPTTWRENGAGFFGHAGPLDWRAYVLAGLSSEGLTASGIRDARQGGSRSLAEDLAFTGRLDYSGAPGLLLGGSVFTGNSGQGAAVGGTPLRARVTLLELHGQYERRGLQLRALGVRGAIGNAALVNAQNGLEGSQSVGERQWGFYLQAAFDVMSLAPSAQWSVTPFVRYEKLDTQDRVPPGFSEDPARERSALTAGIEIKPITQVVFKIDYQRLRTRARTGVSQLNVGVGYLF